jgi:hypothetical protein
MTLTLDLTQEEANWLERTAKAQGVDQTTLVRRWIADLNPTEQTARLVAQCTPEERVRALHEWVARRDKNSPILSEEAISRESIYGDRD